MAWWRRTTEKTVHDPVAVILAEPLRGEVRVMLADDQYVPAVKLVRDRTALNLLPAVVAVNRIRDEGAVPQ
jgi:acetylornithine/succinyldiaminopimelate/putrescine aminotransferase